MENKLLHKRQLKQQGLFIVLVLFFVAFFTPFLIYFLTLN